MAAGRDFDTFFALILEAFDGPAGCDDAPDARSGVFPTAVVSTATAALCILRPARSRANNAELRILVASRWGFDGGWKHAAPWGGSFALQGMPRTMSLS